MPFSTLHIYDPDFSDVCWQKTFDLLNRLHERYNSPIATEDWSSLKERSISYRSINPGYFHFVTMQDGEVAGWLNGELRKGGDGTALAFCRFDLIFDDPPAEYASVTAAELARTVEKGNCSKLYFMATNQRSVRLADAWGATMHCRLERYRLERRNVNDSVISSWLEDYPKRFPNLKTAFFEVIPDELMDDYLDLWRQFIEDMPKEGTESIPFTLTKTELRRRDEWRRSSGQHMYVVALLDENGRMIGHTNGGISEKNPKEMYQAMTGIASEHRGKGLSKWLKASLFKKVGEDFPGNEYLITDMRAVNKPIQVVNARMGFELIDTGSEYLITLDELKDAGMSRR